MKIITIIPARGGSTEIKMKNLVILNKKPLLHYSVTASLKSKLVNRTIVSTDNEKIAKYAKKMGSEVIHRPKKLAGNKIGIYPAILHVLNYLKKNENYEPDLVVTLQNTSPFRNHKHIDDAISLLQKKSYDTVISGFNSKYLLWKNNNKTITPVNYNPLKRPRRQEMKQYFIENGAIYVTNYLSLQKSKSYVCGKVGLYEMPQRLSLEIDTRFDFFLAEQIFKSKKNL
jgi:CMP-N,N'-diacetyllegionaminic acid synthase